MIKIIIAILLYVLTAVLLVAEVFIPSFGIISIIALAALAGGIILFFSYSTAAGWIGILVAAVMVPVLLALAYKILPKTRIGKNVMLEGPKRDVGEGVPDAERIRQLTGQVGTVITAMRPVGMCDFSGLRVEAVAESGYVDKKRKVKVIHVDGTQVTVRVVEEGK